jgi:tripartite-type tricarboxylate transporter receptor subunit TctC
MMRRLFGSFCAAALTLTTAASAFSAFAQGAYPDRSIRMILSFSVGGGTDVVGRVVAKGLSERLGQQAIVDNRAGAGSTLGTGLVNAIASPEVKARFAELGLDVLEPTTPETAAAFVASETTKWAPVIRAADVTGG